MLHFYTVQKKKNHVNVNIVLDMVKLLILYHLRL